MYDVDSFFLHLYYTPMMCSPRMYGKLRVILLPEKQVNIMSTQMLNNASNQVSDVPVDAVRLLDSKVSSNTGNVNSAKGSIKFVCGVTEKDGKPKSQVNNPDEIDIDTDDKDENDAEIEEYIPIEKQAIPSQVFGSLKAAKAED